MNNNYILGGGLIALLAKTIYPSFNIIPMGKSVFYSYNPPLADNKIDASKEEVNEIIRNIKPSSIPILRKNSISFGGSLLFYPVSLALNMYLSKVYDNINQLACKLLRLEGFVHSAKCTDIYNMLQRNYMHDIISSSERYGKVVSIDNHVITTENGYNLDYNIIISTLPLHAAINYVNWNIDLFYRDVYYTYIRSPDIDLEGSEITYVADGEIPFYRVIHIKHDNYVLESFEPLTNQILAAFITNCEVINKTVINKALPIGIPPKLDYLEDQDIYQVGSLAQHDDFMCVASCINRLLKLRTIINENS